MKLMKRGEREKLEEARVRREVQSIVDELEGRDLYELKKILQNFKDIKALVHLIEKLGKGY